MITNLGDYSTAKPMELYGLSTDAKPIGTYKGTKIENTSTFYEFDTKKVFMYDEENSKWLEQ